MQDELHDLHSSLNRLLLGHVAGAGENINAQRVLMEKLAENSWKTLGTDGRIIQKWINTSDRVSYWIHLLLDRDKWRAVVDKAI
jgi:hypothetical protein